MAGPVPVFDPNSTKYPDRIFYRGQWMTEEQIEKKREGERKYRPRYRAENLEKIRERAREQGAKRRSDPDYRRWRTLYMMDYDHRRKHERWANQGLTLRNDGEEGSTSGDRAAA